VSSTTSGRSYSLEPRDHTGVFFGMSVAELAMVGVGLFCVIFFRLAGVPGVISVVPLAVLWPLAKARRVRAQLPLLVSSAWQGLTGRREWLAPLPLLPSVADAPLPPPLRGLAVPEVTSLDGRPFAAVCDRSGGRMTAVLVVRGGQFAAIDPAGQDALLAGWGDVLSSFSSTGSPVVQVGWSDMAAPAGLVEHGMWAGQRLADVGGAAGDPDRYVDLVAEVASMATSHQTVVWITVDGREVRDTPGRPAARAAAHLPAAVDNLMAALGSAGLETPGPMSPAELRRLLRMRIDPFEHGWRPNPASGSLAERLGLVEAHAAGPLAVSTARSQLRMDGSFHRTFWVRCWPRRPVPGDWLTGFLVAGTARTMTVTHYPLDPERSHKRIESQLNKLAAYEERKLDKDRRVTEEDLRTREAVQTLEAELASGHSETLYLGLVTVAAPTLDALDASARHLQQSARTHGIDLRVLHERQDVAWAATLPFGLADPSLLEVWGL
jgi:hypothetical protein